MAKAKKNAKNNQWATQMSVGNKHDHQVKTEFSNEWTSTHKVKDDGQCDCDKPCKS